MVHVRLPHGTAECLGPAVQTEGIEYEHDQDHHSYVRQGFSPARQNERPHRIDSPGHWVELRKKTHPTRHRRQRNQRGAEEDHRQRKKSQYGEEVPVTFHGEGHCHGDGRQADPEHHPDQQDGRHAEDARRRMNTEEIRYAENHEDLHRRDRHDEDKAAQDDRGPMNRRGHQPFEEPVFLIEEQIDAPGEAIVQDRHDDDTGREEADVVGGLHDLCICGTLEQVAEEDEPEQHRLNQSEQHAESFPAQPPNPPHRQ